MPTAGAELRLFYHLEKRQLRAAQVPDEMDERLERSHLSTQPVLMITSVMPTLVHTLVQSASKLLKDSYADTSSFSQEF
jgi:hypothetical protein